MFYDFEEIKEEKVWYRNYFGDLLEIDNEELQATAYVMINCIYDSEEAREKFLKYAELVKEKTKNLAHITTIEIWQANFTPEIVKAIAECFPYLKTVKIVFSEFSAGAIAAFRFFSQLHTLKINDYRPENYFRLQEFGVLKQLRYLIITNSAIIYYNFDSLAFLKSMNLEKLEIENLVSVFNPAVNNQFNASLLSCKKLQQQEKTFQKYIETAAPGKKSCIKAAANFFARGKIAQGIEYLYLYAGDETPHFTVSQGPADREFLLWQWHDTEKLTDEYFKKRKLLLKIYPYTRQEIGDFFHYYFWD